MQQQSAHRAGHAKQLKRPRRYTRDVEVTPKSLPDPATTRIAALDVGDRRIGVAITDELGYTAQPLFTLHRTNNRRADIKSLGRLLRRHHCTHVVVGNPVHMSGDLSPQAEKAQAFANELASALGVTIYLWDERLTTAAAHEILDAAGHSTDRRDRKDIIDQVAAVLILESFLQAQIQPTRDEGTSQL